MTNHPKTHDWLTVILSHTPSYPICLHCPISLLSYVFIALRFHCRVFASAVASSNCTCLRAEGNIRISLFRGDDFCNFLRQKCYLYQCVFLHFQFFCPQKHYKHWMPILVILIYYISVTFLTMITCFNFSKDAIIIYKVQGLSNGD